MSATAAILEQCSGYPHGTRARYTGGCRCAECRGANAARYHERQRAIEERAGEVEPSGPPIPDTITRGGHVHRIERCPGANGAACVRTPASWLKIGRVCAACVERATIWDGFVDAGPVLEHVRSLSALGVGYKTVADAAGVAASSLGRLLSGERKRLRASTERRILEVDAGAVADRALVDARGMNDRVRAMRERGFSLRELAGLLGYQGHALQIGRTELATAANVARVDRLWKRIERGEVKPAAHRNTIEAPEERAWLARMLRYGVPVAWVSKRLGFAVPSSGGRARMLESRAIAIRELRAELDRLVREGVVPGAPPEALRGIALTFELPPSCLRSEP